MTTPHASSTCSNFHVPIRILFLLPSLEPGGSERIVITLATRLDRSRFTPELAVLQANGVLATTLPTYLPLHDLAVPRARLALPKLIRLIQYRRPAIVCSTLGHLNMLMAMAQPFLPHRIQLIGRESCVLSRAHVTRPHPHLLDFLACRLLPRLDFIICQSRDILLDLHDHYHVPETQMMVIHNPVDTSELQTRAKAMPPPLQSIHSTYNQRHLVAAGRLVHQKGFDLLLKALAYLADQIPNLHCTILGQGPEEAQLRAMIETLGLADRVFLAGFVADPAPYFFAADLFVLPSRFEGLPNVLLEALACGTPAVACTCPGGINEIIQSGQNGLTCLPEDAAALAKTIATALASQFNRATIAADITARFDTAVILPQYESFFTYIAGTVPYT
ncbi:N-acetylgalactosamine-N, N'-diacetylbacillosaminyl-diphospho-undecaprenol 4-alpha-N-acetylgalactosaminyltransferase [Desulfovibrionales bacterium]